MEILSTNQGEFMGDAFAEFEILWNAPQTLEYETFIELYRNIHCVRIPCTYREVLEISEGDRSTC